MGGQWLELMCVGGASIIVWACTFMFTSTTESVATVALFAATLSFVCNQPHFLASYTLLYWDFRKNIFKSMRYFWAAVIVPLVLIGFLAYALISHNPLFLRLTIQAMFFLVGWHYVKQIFGCVIVSTVRSERFLTKIERRAVWCNLMSVWAVNMSNGPLVVTPQDYHGLRYLVYPQSPLQLPIVASLFLLSFLFMVGVFIRKYIKEGVTPPAMAVVSMASIYIWFLPSFHHPVFGYMVPFFHSLQYLVLSGQFKFNKEVHNLGDLTGEARRLRWFKSYILYWTVVFLLGMVFFEFLPKSLDKWLLFPEGAGLGPTPFLASFLVFINVHHYFIDNVIWRSDNSEVKKFLFDIRPNPQLSFKPLSVSLGK